MTSPKEDHLAQLEAQGVAVWLDDISRERTGTGKLQQLIGDYPVVGGTSNPTIFASPRYDSRWAADVLAQVYDESHPLDGRVSLEVGPRLPRETEKTIAEAKALWWMVDRPHTYIKITG